MFFLNLHAATLDDETLATADHDSRSVWLHLMRHCIGQENGGLIEDCRQWTERKWLLLCRVTSAEVLKDSALWTWEGDDLRLWGYPDDAEKKVKKQRRFARDANRRRWSGNASSQGSESPSGIGSEQTSEHASEFGSNHGSENQSEFSSTAESPSDSEKGKGKRERGKRKGEMGNGAVLPSDLSDPIRLRIAQVGEIMHRRESTAWSAKEMAAFRAAALDRLPDEEFVAQRQAVADYYAAPLPWLREHWERPDGDFRRRDLLTLLNNWGGEVDRSEKYADWFRKKCEGEAAARMGSSAT